MQQDKLVTQRNETVKRQMFTSDAVPGRTLYENNEVVCCSQHC